jgi:peptidyl-prolyl cis-trans isomerase C
MNGEGLAASLIRVKVISFVAPAALIALLLSPAAAAAQGQPPAAPASPAAPAETIKPIVEPLPDVVARVNGETISRDDLESAMVELQQRAGQQVPPDQRDKVVRAVLDQLIAYRLLKQESAARKIEVAQTEVDARIDELKSQFKSEEVFIQVLGEQKVTLDELRTNIREGMQIDRMVDTEINTRATVTPEQVEAFYTANPTEFQRGERIRASHILVRVAPDADAPAKEQARTKIDDLLKQARGGADFAALAKQHSDDPGSGPTGGDLGYFERGQMVGPFEDAAFALTPGQTSEVIETQFGFHIIKLDDRQAAGPVPLSDVRPQIEEFLQGRNRETQAQAFIESLRAKGKVEVFI